MHAWGRPGTVIRSHLRSRSGARGVFTAVRGMPTQAVGERARRVTTWWPRPSEVEPKPRDMNDPQRYERIYAIYVEAMEQQEDVARTAFLDRACAGDASLRAEVESLLRQPLPRPLADTVIDRRFADEAPIDSAGMLSAIVGRQGTPERIGAYRILAELGRGGMGVVYEAEQESPRRMVALKVVNAGVVAPRLLRRFQYEAEVLGRLQHPGIAQVYEAGTFDTGAGAQPFFAMELVRGVTLTEHCEEHQLSVMARLELLARICDAVQHAHQRGVIHRDLKPANILVDATGQPKVLDFGIARATESDIQVTTIQTDVGQLIGTVPYMSPEQAAGDPDELDTRSDVYALGVIAYQLLTGHLPYDVHGKMIHEAVRMIREDDPAPLSSVNRTFRGDVETIIAKALAKEKARRYEGASALAADIRRYLDDEPITARPASTWYQVRKFARRNRVLVGGVVATFLALSIGLAGTIRYATREAEQRAETTRRVEELSDVIAYQETQLSGFDTVAIGDRIREVLIESVRTARRRAGDAQAELDGVEADLDRLLSRVDLSTLAQDVLRENVFMPARASIRAHFSDRPLVRARLLATLARSMIRSGLSALARQDLEEALAEQSGALPDHHPDVLVTLEGLTSATRNDPSQSGQRLAYLQRLVPALERSVGEDDPRTRLHETDLFATLLNSGGLDEAKAIIARRLARVEAGQASGTADEIVLRGHLIAVLGRQGKIEEAEAQLRSLIDASRRTLGDQDPRTLGSIANHASLLGRMGDLEGALDASRRALELGGRDGPNLGFRLEQVARYLERLGRFEEAEPPLREALALWEDERGRASQSAARILVRLAVIVAAQGRVEEATEIARESWGIRRELFGDGDSRTLYGLHQYLKLLTEARHFTEAEGLTLELEQQQARVHGHGSPPHTNAVHQLIALYEAWHEAAPDAGHGDRAETWRATLPEETPDP